MWWWFVVVVVVMVCVPCVCVCLRVSVRGCSSRACVCACVCVGGGGVGRPGKRLRQERVGGPQRCSAQVARVPSGGTITGLQFQSVGEALYIMAVTTWPAGCVVAPNPGAGGGSRACVAVRALQLRHQGSTQWECVVVVVVVVRNPLEVPSCWCTLTVPKGSRGVRFVGGGGGEWCCALARHARGHCWDGGEGWGRGCCAL